MLFRVSMPMKLNTNFRVVFHIILRSPYCCVLHLSVYRLVGQCLKQKKTHKAQSFWLVLRYLILLIEMEKSSLFDRPFSSWIHIKQSTKSRSKSKNKIKTVAKNNCIDLFCFTRLIFSSESSSSGQREQKLKQMIPILYARHMGQ